MFTAYQRLLAQAPLRNAFVASLIARMPIGMGGLALLLLLQASSSYAWAGVVTSGYLAGLAAAAPVLGRTIDRLGPRPVLIACLYLYPLALLAIVATVLADLPRAWTLALAIGAGATFPPVTVCQRALLRQRLENDPLFITALSLDSVLIELVFIIGPLLVALLVAAWSAAAAVAATAACALLGVILFLRTPALAAWTRSSHPPGPLLGPLATPGFLGVLAVGSSYAIVFGLVEIGLTAFAAEAGRPALAGVLLGVMSVGSAAGGLAYGGRNWHLPLATQSVRWLALMGLSVLPLALLRDLWLFGVACLLAGIAMAPALIIQSTLVAKTVSSRYATEGFTWSMAALLCGVGAGLAAGGVLLEYAGVSQVFAVAAIISLATAALAWKALPRFAAGADASAR